jgi:hypothetical protein
VRCACSMQRIVLHSSPLVRFPTLFRYHQPTNTHSAISQSAQYRSVFRLFSCCYCTAPVQSYLISYCNPSLPLYL